MTPPTSLKTLKDHAAKEQQVQAARELLELIREVEDGTTLRVTSLNTEWNSELDNDKQEYQELQELRLNCRGGAALVLGICCGEVEGDSQLDNDERASLRSSVQDCTSLRYSEAVSALNLGVEEDASWTRADLRRLAGETVPEQDER